MPHRIGALEEEDEAAIRDAKRVITSQILFAVLHKRLPQMLLDVHVADCGGKLVCEFVAKCVHSRVDKLQVREAEQPAQDAAGATFVQAVGSYENVGKFVCHFPCILQLRWGSGKSV
jgi:hypothetical protein